MPEFIAYAKANPGKLNMASNGNGTAAHVAGKLFKMMAGLNMVHVRYRGASFALTDMHLDEDVIGTLEFLPTTLARVSASCFCRRRTPFVLKDCQKRGSVDEKAQGLLTRSPGTSPSTF